MDSVLIDRMLELKSFTVLVKPNSKKNVIVKFDNTKNSFIVEIKAEARNNKANIELIKYISKQLKHKVEIIKGFKSREKLLRLR